MKINIEDKNLLDYSDWDQYPDDGNTGYFSRSNIYVNNINTRVTATDPFNNQATVWDSYSINSGTTPYYRCGYFSDNILIDPTKKYRTSVWVRRLTNSENTFYFGFRNYDINYNLVTPKNKITGVVQASTCYTTSGNINPWFNIGEWVLFVGHIWSYDTEPGGTNDTASGFYLNGLKTHNTTDFIFNSATTYINQRLYSPYLNPPFSEDSHWQYIYPRIDLVDGTEPSIQTLLSSEGNWRTINTGGTYINIEDKNLVDYSNWSEEPYSGSIIGSWYEWAAKGGANFRELGTDAFGNETYLWKTSGNTSGFKAGISQSYNSWAAPIDASNTYRTSIWVKRINTTGSNSAFYFGFSAYSGESTRDCRRCTDGLIISNFYYLQLNSDVAQIVFPENQWRLIVGYIRSNTQDYTTDSNYYCKVYDISGAIGQYKYDYQFYSGITDYTTLSARIYAPYNETGNLNISYSFSYPRIDLVDGTEPSVATLLTNEGNWRKINDMKINVGDDWKNTI